MLRFSNIVSISTSISTSVRPPSGFLSTAAEQDIIGKIPCSTQLPVAIMESQRSMTLHGNANQQSLLQLVKFALYLASNNLLSDEIGESLLRLVIESKQESALAAIFKEKMPIIEAFARFTFKHALCIRNANILRICLQAGADPNLPLKSAYSRLSRTPLEVSIYDWGNIELTKVLLDAGAHTNDLSTLSWARFSPTSLAALTAHFNTELVQTLLDLSADCWL